MLGSRGRKERKRLMALLLAGAMVLSGMGISPFSVQAEETETVVEQINKTVSDGNAEMTENSSGELSDITSGSAEKIADETIAQETEKVSEVAAQAAGIAVPVVQSADGTYVFEASALSVVAAGAKADGDTEAAGTEDYFTLIYSAKTKVDSSSKSFDDGYSSSQRVNFGDVVSVDKNAILNGSGTVVAQTKETLAKNAACCSE